MNAHSEKVDFFGKSTHKEQQPKPKPKQNKQKTNKIRIYYSMPFKSAQDLRNYASLMRLDYGLIPTLCADGIV